MVIVGLFLCHYFLPFKTIDFSIKSLVLIVKKTAKMMEQQANGHDNKKTRNFYL